MEELSHFLPCRGGRAALGTGLCQPWIGSKGGGVKDQWEPANVRTTFEEDIRRVLANIPRGTVMTYGEVAVEAGRPAASRAVGNLLARAGGDLSWWRVVNSQGRLVPGNESEQAQRLRAEGVEIANGRVTMRAVTKRPSKNVGATYEERR